MSRLSRSAECIFTLLRSGDLSGDDEVRDLLSETNLRREMDLSDLSPTEQARLIEGRSQYLQPSADALAGRIVRAAEQGRLFVAKFGIDPTGAEVHLGHAVPMMVLSRLQRMGHQVVFIIGDMTARIGDPSGRSDERPALSDDDIARNLATYRQQVAPFFDFSRAEFRHNGDWLSSVTLPRIIEITAQIPVSMALQRDDFRTRLDAGHGLSLAELMYSVVMALDSVETGCDLEIGGIDQYLNMQMCRKVMDICHQEPELVVATPLIEGTDGTGSKMSKSRSNYVPLTARPADMFGKIMSIPDRLMEPYFRALSEWLDPELAVVRDRVTTGDLHPMDLKKILAGEVTASIHGMDAAMSAREEFVARFSERIFAAVEGLPEIGDLGRTITETLKSLGFASSNGEVRRTAQQNGLRLVAETEGGQTQVTLSEDEAREPLAVVLDERLGDQPGDRYIKFGRKLVRILFDQS